jgi:hypothetical protein
LPRQVDCDRFTAEFAARAEQAIREVVLGLVVRSLKDGHPYEVVLSGHRVTAMVRASEGTEAYLTIGAEGFVQPKIIGTILNSVPGIDRDDWQAEPGGVAGITPEPGQIIWSTIIPPDVQADILAHADETDE